MTATNYAVQLYTVCRIGRDDAVSRATLKDAGATWCPTATAWYVAGDRRDLPGAETIVACTESAMDGSGLADRLKLAPKADRIAKARELGKEHGLTRGWDATSGKWAGTPLTGGVVSGPAKI